MFAALEELSSLERWTKPPWSIREVPDGHRSLWPGQGQAEDGWDSWDLLQALSFGTLPVDFCASQPPHLWGQWTNCCSLQVASCHGNHDQPSKPKPKSPFPLCQTLVGSIRAGRAVLVVRNPKPWFTKLPKHVPKTRQLHWDSLHTKRLE